LLNRQHANGYAPLEDENVDQFPLCSPGHHHQSEGLGLECFCQHKLGYIHMIVELNLQQNCAMLIGM